MKAPPTNQVEVSPQDSLESAPPKIALLTEGRVPQCVTRLVDSGRIDLTSYTPSQIVADIGALADCRLVLMVSPTVDWVHKQFRELLDAIQKRKLVVLILADDLGSRPDGHYDEGSLLPRIYWHRADIDADQLDGRIRMLMEHGSIFGRIETYVAQLENWAMAVNNRFEALHQELRLAWRVQQDFLPKELPEMRNVRFSALYRPAQWVSGDIYDVVRLDETHIGFYVADVVGHGVAAGLLTLFVKRAMVMREVSGHSHRVLPPGRVLSKLNDDLCELELPEQQFVTACYALLNTQTLDLSVARAGHPLPILLDRSGRSTKLDPSGPLLGVFPATDFAEQRIRLARGNRLILVSDGLESAFGKESDGEQVLLQHLTKLAPKRSHEIVASFQGILDCQESSLHPDDDMTMIVAEVRDAG